MPQSTHAYTSTLTPDTIAPTHRPTEALPQKHIKMASPPQQQAYQSTQDTDTHQQPFRNQNRHHDRPQTHNPNQPMNYMPSVRAASEKKLGLLHFSSPQNHGWHGDVRKRYVTAGTAWPRLVPPLDWVAELPLTLTHPSIN